MPKKGFKQTEEHKRKIGESRKGAKRSKESKLKMSEWQLGKNATNWNGGNASYWANELKKIYKDCYFCHSNIQLEMHHKDKDRDNNERYNLIIICKICHRFWHRK